MSCLGLVSDKGDKITLAVWRRETDACELAIDMSKYLNASSKVKMTYPADPMGAEYSFDAEALILNVRLPKKNSARFFEIEVK